ncbi:SPRY domain-containing protein [Marinobacterium stanieri]
MLGLASPTAGFSASSSDLDDTRCLVYYGQVGGYWCDTTVTSGLATAGPGDVIGLAIDFDADTMWFSVNGVWQDGDPTGDTGGITISNYITGPYLIVGCTYHSGESLQLNFGQAAYSYPPPTGFA